MNRKWRPSPAFAIVLLQACVSGDPPPEPEKFVTVRYRGTDDVASRMAAGDAASTTRRGAGVVDASDAGRIPSPYPREKLEAFREQLLAETVEGRKETQLTAMGLEALSRGDVGAALDHTRDAWVSLQESRSRTLEEDMASSPAREIAWAYAVALLASSERKEGVLLLEKLVATSPGWLPAYESLFGHYMVEGATLLAEKVARRALGFASDASSVAHVMLARALREQGKREEALDVLKGAEVAFPQDSAIGLWIGLLMHDAGFLTESCERFSLAYQRLRGSEDAAFNHGLCLARERRWDEADNVVKLALIQHPQSASLRLLAGNVARLAGRDAEAYRVWREFLDISHPRDPRRAHVENAIEDLRQAGVEGKSGPKP